MWGDKKQEGPVPSTRPAGSGAAAATATATITAAPTAPPETKEVHVTTNTLEASRPIPTTTGGALARIGPSLHIKGEITGNEDLEIHGTVEGTVTLEERKLTVGSTAKVSADLAAREIVIYGSVKGNLRARDRIEIKKDGSVVGDLSTARIMIEDGAYFKGSIEITREGETEKARTARVG
jgi:cytoskeletal protein CcmA (bactofilin family)